MPNPEPNAPPGSTTRAPRSIRDSDNAGRPRILIVGPAWVGDMVMAQCLFKLLKQRHPDALIDVVAPAWTLPLVERMPEVTDVVPLPLGHGELALGTRWRLGRTLRERRYDRALVLPRSLKSAVIPFAAGARRRTGYFGECRWGLLNDIRRLDRHRLPRTVDRFMALALEREEALPGRTPYPHLAVDTDRSRQTLEKLGIPAPAGPVLGLCPGAEYGPAKRWPPEHFAAVARDRLEHGWQVWLFGSDKDASITARIQSLTGGRCLDLGGRTRLTEALDLMALATAVVTNDSGLMHVAAALDRPVVAVYGSSDPGFTPPLSDKASVVRLDLECSPCFRRECPYGHYRCLQELEPAQVLDLLDDKVKIQEQR